MAERGEEIPDHVVKVVIESLETGDFCRLNSLPENDHRAAVDYLSRLLDHARRLPLYYKKGHGENG